MPLEESDVAYLADMLIAARRIERFMTGIAYTAFEEDDMRAMAVERAFEIIGEAARLLSAGFRESNPTLPIAQMIGLRNIIAHEYADIDYRVLYRVATVDVPQLIHVLESLVPDSPESPE